MTFFRSLLVAAIAVAATCGSAFAGSDRSLSLYNTNTRESLTVTYFRNGSYDGAALKKLNWFLRDWRRNEATKMDPLLFDLVHEVYMRSGAKEPIHVHSGYRSKKTNDALRKRSTGVARNSQHIQGKAMDFRIPDVKPSELREIAMKLQVGGVGYYPRSASPFVHLDVSGVRHWPKMSSRQLAKLFPDGKTIHVPSNGKPLKGYQVAKAELAKTPKATRIKGSGANASRNGSGRNLLARIFTGGRKSDAGAEPVESPSAAPVVRTASVSKGSPGASSLALVLATPMPKPKRHPEEPIISSITTAYAPAAEENEKAAGGRAPFDALLGSTGTAQDRSISMAEILSVSGRLHDMSELGSLDNLQVIAALANIRSDVLPVLHANFSDQVSVEGIPELTSVMFSPRSSIGWVPSLEASAGISPVALAKARLRKKLLDREYGIQPYSFENWLSQTDEIDAAP